MNKIKKSAFYCIPVFMLIVSLITVFEHTIWVDEAYSLELARHSMPDIVRIDSLDVHPPLYYMILRIGYLILGGIWNPVWIGRLMSLVPYIILVLIGFSAVKKQFGDTAAFLFNTFIVGMPQMLLYSTEIRMYSWGMLFVTCAFLQFAKILSSESNRKAFCLLTMYSALAAYTHYFACASAIVIYAELFLLSLLRKNYRRIKSTIVSGLGVVGLYLPWLFIFISQTSAVKESYWIPPLTLKTIRGYFLFLFDTRSIIEIAILALVFTAFAVSVRLSVKKRAVPAPTSEQLHNIKPSGARSTFFGAISYKAKERAVPAPTSEQLHNIKPFSARSTFFGAISYKAKERAVPAHASEQLHNIKPSGARSTFGGANSCSIKEEDDIPLCGIGVWAGTILLGVVLSLVIRPIFASRYMMGAAACFWLGAAIALSRIEIKQIRYGIVVLSLGICMAVGLLYVREEIRTENNFDEAYQVLSSSINDETTIISDYNHVQRVVGYYFPQNESMVVGEPLSDLTKMVYASCHLTRVDTADDLDADSLHNTLILDIYGELGKALEKKAGSMEHLGQFKIDRYQFDAYYIK